MKSAFVDYGQIYAKPEAIWPRFDFVWYRFQDDGELVERAARELLERPPYSKQSRRRRAILLFGFRGDPKWPWKMRTF